MTNLEAKTRLETQLYWAEKENEAVVELPTQCARSLLAELEALTKERDELRELLKSLEWTYDANGYDDYCQVCGGFDSLDGHRPDCDLKAALGAPAEGRDAE